MANLDLNGPGRILDIEDIPSVVTDDHNEVFYYWQHSTLRDATLFHIDGHDDMQPGAPNYDLKLEDIPTYYFTIGIGSFIVPAFYYGIISSIWWLNPHSASRKLQFMGSNDPEGERPLEVNTRHNPEFGCHFGFRLPVNPTGSFTVEGIIKDSVEFKDTALILDLDLDAFCCHRWVSNTPWSYAGVDGYEKRIEETLKLLMSLKRPDLITITLSRGQFASHKCYVPPELSEEIERLTVEGLRKVYQ